MTRAHSYSAKVDSRGRPYYIIDGERVTGERYHDSYAKSERVRAFQSRGEESGRFGTLREEFYERRRIARELERIPSERREPGRVPPERPRALHRYVVATFRERIRGTRISQSIVRVFSPGISESEVRSLLDSSYDRGGNYVLSIDQIETTEPTAETRDEVARSYSEGIISTGDADRS